MFRVCEIFDSIQGEGLYMGMPVTFLRMSGCNRKCIYCDTYYHIDSKQFGDEGLWTHLSGKNLRNLVVTGGEPLLQWPSLKIFFDRYKPLWDVHLETNGTILLSEADMYYFKSISISPKLISSGHEEDLGLIVKHWKSIAPKLLRRVEIFFKFVVQGEADRLQLASVLDSFDWMTPVVIQPQTNELWQDDFKETIKWFSNQAWNRFLDVRFMPRWHVVLWGNERKR